MIFFIFSWFIYYVSIWNDDITICFWLLHIHQMSWTWFIFSWFGIFKHCFLFACTSQYKHSNNQLLPPAVCLLNWFKLLFWWSKMHSILNFYQTRQASANVSTTPLRQFGFWQCLPFSWTILRDKHCGITLP